ncbi:uncharacterized protein LOC121856246 [Homarus americanus]|uniref:uncharacterized protein LOC121856246 n=1 Tax=Homarus americanus TaxID=6706 RepID=UPI001C45533C|nr:uncharacterized protein LOC121856246 [Homarus americanus]
MRRNRVAERAEVRQSSRGGKREARFVGGSITGASAVDKRGAGVGPAEARRFRGHERASATTGKGSAMRAGKSEDIVDRRKGANSPSRTTRRRDRRTEKMSFECTAAVPGVYGAENTSGLRLGRRRRP